MGKERRRGVAEAERTVFLCCERRRNRERQPCLLTRLSRSSASWPRSRRSTGLFHSGFACELTTRSGTTPSAGTGEGLSSDCKRHGVLRRLSSALCGLWAGVCFGGLL